MNFSTVKRYKIRLFCFQLFSCFENEKKIPFAAAYKRRFFYVLNARNHKEYFCVLHRLIVLLERTMIRL